VADLDADTIAGLGWSPTSSGKAVAVAIRSPGAASLRVGVRVDAMPAGAVLRFSGANTAHWNGETMFWSPSIPGDTVVVEIDIPADTDARFSIPMVSHRPPAIEPRRATGTSSPANLDVSCYPEWAEQSKSVALLDYVSEGYSYTCTGTLLGDAAGTETPYLLTAAHCIRTQAAASTLETTWFFRSASCGSQTVNPGVKVVSGGAALLYASADTGREDAALLRLNGRPPIGAVFAGWWPTYPSVGTPVTVLHHPMADLQKISFGNVNAAPYSRIGAKYSAGKIEGGSSGSGAWVLHPDGRRYLIGDLTDGFYCDRTGTTECSYFTRLDLIFDNLHRWLGDSSAATAYQSDCLFNWAESAYPNLFYPSASSATQAPYYYRHYAGTGAYLGKSSQDERVYYLGPLSGGGLLDLGALSEWVVTAGCR
jgi:hypothetical protein